MNQIETDEIEQELGMGTLKNLLDKLSHHLPRIAEEGRHTSSTTTNALIQTLSEENQLSEEYCRGVLETLSQHWVAIGLLDREKLKQGVWDFSSFPASLLARAILDVLSWDRPQLESSEWWVDAKHMEENRKLLIKFEERRSDFSRRPRPKPIRTVQAAWAFIKIEGRILLHKREDGERRHRANFVPIGGRLNLDDLESAFPESTVAERLQWQQDHELSRIEKAVEFTLKREMLEELRMRETEHYNFKGLFNVDPYEKLDGPKANYAQTLYHIFCFFVELTEAGFRRLCHCVQSEPENFIWATPLEVVRGKQGDRRLYVDALKEGIGTKPLNRLKAISESVEDIVNFEGEVDLPCEGQEEILHGRSGQEKKVQLDLSPFQIGVLQGLGWHRIHSVQHPLEPIAGVTLHPKGWIEIGPALKEMRGQVFELGALLDRVGLPIIEGDNSGWFRLSAKPGKLYFGEPFFQMDTLHPEEKNYQVLLQVDQIMTPIGKIPQTTLIIDKVLEVVYGEVRKILSGEEALSEKDLTSLFKQYLTRKSKPLGLRIPIRHKKGKYYTNCN